MNEWAAQPLPLSAAAHSGDTLYVRLSGTAAGIGAAHHRLGGELLEKGQAFWEALREHRRGFFQDPAPLWRLSVPAAAPPLELPGKWLLDWGGAQRWLLTEAPGDQVVKMATTCGGHAEPYRPATLTRSLPAGLLRLNQAVKSAFDPHAILNGAAVR